MVEIMFEQTRKIISDNENLVGHRNKFELDLVEIVIHLTRVFTRG